VRSDTGNSLVDPSTIKRRGMDRFQVNISLFNAKFFPEYPGNHELPVLLQKAFPFLTGWTCLIVKICCR
jgi:hypothetical protein